MIRTVKRFLLLESACTGQQFAAFRLAFGVYLMVHCAALSFDAPEVFSSAGMLPDGRVNPTAGIFPNLLLWFDSPAQVVAFSLSLAALSLCIALGLYRRAAAPVVWYGLACLFNRNVLIQNPSLPFIGWLLLALALIPENEPYRLLPRSKNQAGSFRLPPLLYSGAWYLTAVGYTASGLHKLTAPSWRDGSALEHVLSIPLARNVPWREWFLQLDPSLLHALTWGAVAAECIYLPLALFQSTRPLAWLSMVGMHLGILCFIDFADLTAALLLLHLFLFDPAWLKQPKLRGALNQLTIRKA